MLFLKLWPELTKSSQKWMFSPLSSEVGGCFGHTWRGRQEEGEYSREVCRQIGISAPANRRLGGWGDDHHSMASPESSSHKPHLPTATLKEEQQLFQLSYAPYAPSTTKPAAITSVIPPFSRMLLWVGTCFVCSQRSSDLGMRLNLTMFYCWCIFYVLVTCKNPCPMLDE